MTGWRPEGWDTYEELSHTQIPLKTIIPSVFEAGADAMLEALSRVPEDGSYFVDRFTGESGKKYRCVFIPTDT